MLRLASQDDASDFSMDMAEFTLSQDSILLPLCFMHSGCG